MTFWDFARGSASSRLLVEYGVERGYPAVELLKGSDLTLGQLDDPKAELTAAQELRITNNLLKLADDPWGLGIRMGLRYHLSAYGIWGYGLLSSATTEEALTLALRFIPLTYAYTLISYREEGEFGILSFGEPDFQLDLRRFFVERDMTAAAVLLREISRPEFKIARVTFRAEPNRKAADPDEVNRAFEANPYYGAATNSLAFDRAYLRSVLPQANPVTASMCEQMCAELVERRRSRSSTAGIVRQYLGVSGSSFPDLSAMARILNVSERTLKRRLQEEGTSFRTLLAESRCSAAESLLKDHRLTMTDIASRLGFSDSSTFSQAFKRWYGVAPQVYRKAGLRKMSGG